MTAAKEEVRQHSLKRGKVWIRKRFRWIAKLQNQQRILTLFLNSLMPCWESRLWFRSLDEWMTLCRIQPHSIINVCTGYPVVTLHQIRLLQKYTSVFQEATFERATRNSFLLLSVFLLKRDKHGPELQRTHVKVRSEKLFIRSVNQFNKNSTYISP